MYSSIQGVPYVGIMENPTEAAEAVAVGKMIEQMVGGTGFHAIDFNAVDSTTETDLGFSDFAVLFRTGAQSAVYEDVFSKAGIPYQTARRDPLLKRTGYRQVVSCLKLIYGCGTYSDLIRWCDVFDIPVSESQLASFRSWGLTQRLNVHKALEEVGSRSGVDPKIGELGGVLSQPVDRLRSDVGGLEMDEQIARFMELGNIPLETDADACLSDMMTVIAATGSVNGIGVLSRLALKTDADLVNRRSQKVLLMSMHAAKGLEFPVVFISGCEAGLIPYTPSGHQSVDPDEERRLFYVAMTRAQSHLFLTWSKQRRIYGRRRHQKRSPFVENIDEHLTRAFVPLEGKHQQPKPAQLGLFVE